MADMQRLNFLQHCQLKVGVIGGSFNPAHLGHLLVTNQVLKMLNFDYVIWSVAQQNPLKPPYKLDIVVRSHQARLLAAPYRRIIVATLEAHLSSNYTYDALQALKRRYSSVHFTWLMGADNLENFHLWHRYQEIPNLCQIIVFDRPNYSKYFNFSRFSLKFKAAVAKNQTHNIILYHGFMLQNSSSTTLR